MSASESDSESLAMQSSQLPTSLAGQAAPFAPGLLAMDDSQRVSLTEQLLMDHHDRVFRYAYHLLGCKASAEDIVQEVFLRAHARVHQLRSMDSASGWLLAIARNEVARWCNKWKVVQANDMELAGDFSQERELEDHEWLHHCLQDLAFEFRQVVLMYYFEQKSYLQIAEELDLPMGTVMSRLNRARSHLKESLVSSAGAASCAKKSEMRRKVDTK